MKRVGVWCLTGLVLACASAGALAAASSHARLRAFACRRALKPSHRQISVTAVMTPLSGTRSMQLRFELLEQSMPGGSESQVTGSNLGSWISPSNPTLGSRPGDVWILRHPVRDLGGPATYRFRVSFRWKGQHRRTLATTTLLSSTCYEPERRPDLLVKSIKLSPAGGQSGGEDYLATIRNAGHTAAGPFEVWFSDGTTVVKRSVPGLAAHGTLQETFVGPTCTPGSPPTVTVDPTHEVNDADPGNNTLRASC